MFKYETHLHTAPVSRCAIVSVEENLKFYKSKGYDGVFITNHFIGGNIYIDSSASYEEKINYFFSDYEKGVEIGRMIGLKVFCGVEFPYNGTDFLVYGLDKEWYISHPEIIDMKKRKALEFMIESDALVIHAHPFREESYIDHIRLLPRSIHGVEVINGCRTDFENKMAKLYAENYGLLEMAGSDNHEGEKIKDLAGVLCEEQIINERDFVTKVKSGKIKIFIEQNNKT